MHDTEKSDLGIVAVNTCRSGSNCAILEAAFCSWSPRGRGQAREVLIWVLDDQC